MDGTIENKKLDYGTGDTSQIAVPFSHSKNDRRRSILILCAISDHFVGLIE